MEKVGSYYYLKDILLAFRTEYIKYQNEMQLLKQYLEILNTEYQDFYLKFDCHSKEMIENKMANQIEFRAGKNLEVYVALIKKKNILDYYISKIFKVDDPLYMLLKDSSMQYFSCSDDINILNHKLLSEKINQMLDSNFVLNMNYSVIKNLNNNNKLQLNISLDFIDIIELDNDSYKFKCTFIPNLEQLMITSNQNISKNFINEILKIEIPSQMLNDYFINAINKSNNNNLLIDMDDHAKIHKKNITLNLYDNKDSFTLKK